MNANVKRQVTSLPANYEMARTITYNLRGLRK